MLRELPIHGTTVVLAPTAKEVRSLTRSLDVSDDRMHYVIEMAAVGQGLQFHLEAMLHRVDGMSAERGILRPCADQSDH